MLPGLGHPPKQGPSDGLVTLNPKSYNNMSQPNTQNDVLTRIHRVLIWGYKLFSLKLAQTPKQGPCKDHSPSPRGLHGFHASFWEGCPDRQGNAMAGQVPLTLVEFTPTVERTSYCFGTGNATRVFWVAVEELKVTDHDMDVW